MTLWSNKRLDEVASVRQGGKLKLSGKHFVHEANDSYPAFGAGGLNGWLPIKEFDQQAVVLSSIGARCGKCFLTPDAWTSLANTQIIFADKTQVDAKFLWYQLNDEARWPRSGAAQPFIKPSDVKAHVVRIPLLSEQKRIVGILNQSFEGIAKATANAEKNLANAKELYANAFNNLLGLRCQDVPTASLDSIADFKNGLNFTRSSKGEVIKIVGVADFKNNFWTPDELEEVQIEGKLSKAYELRDDDILVVRSNGNKELIGRCILARDVEGQTSHSGFTIRVRPRSDAVDSEYLTHFMKSSAVRKSLVASGDGANISSLNQKALSSIVVPIPPVSVQRDIVNDLSMLGEKIGQMTAIMAHKSRAIDELHRSALHQAFSGNL